jgi:hypothetical protein
LHVLFLLYGALAPEECGERDGWTLCAELISLACSRPHAITRRPYRFSLGERVLQEPDDLAVQGPVFVLGLLL